MRNLIELPTINVNEELNLEGVVHRQHSYGHKEIIVELEYKGERKRFSSITNDMLGFDEAEGIESIEEWQVAMYSLISLNIEEEVEAWTKEINDK